MNKEKNFSDLHRRLQGLKEKYPGVREIKRTTTGVLVVLRPKETMPDYKSRGDARISLDVSSTVMTVFGDDAKKLDLSYEAYTEGDAIKVKEPE